MRRGPSASYWWALSRLRLAWRAGTEARRMSFRLLAMQAGCDASARLCSRTGRAAGHGQAGRTRGCGRRALRPLSRSLTLVAERIAKPSRKTAFCDGPGPWSFAPGIGIADCRGFRRVQEEINALREVLALC